MKISVATWNTEWRTPNSEAGHRIAAILKATGSDVIVVTEGVPGLLPEDGHIVDAGPDWGYSPERSRRKVIVWSGYPLTLELVDVEGATRGRFVVAIVALPGGPVRVVGVCIPWRDAHVRSGRRDAQPWSEHLNYLDHLERFLLTLDDEIPTVIAGDFNQRIPRGHQPIRVADRLKEVLADWTIHTAGALPNGPHIDHIATNHRIVLESTHDWPCSDHLGRLSDHAGVVCHLFRAENLMQGVNGRPATEPDQFKQADVTVVQEDTLIPGGPMPPDGPLTPELRAEVEDILRRSGDGFSHGATFRLRERGLSDADIAAERGVSLSTTRGFFCSLDALLTGALPNTKSAALTNSYVYREMLNYSRSDTLDCYVKAQLRKLKEVNPDVSIAPLNTRSHQYRVGESRQNRGADRKGKTTTEDSCPECAAIGIIHSGAC